MTTVRADGRFVEHGPPSARCTWSERLESEMGAARKARERQARRRLEWGKMHATKSPEGWQRKEVYPTWGEARRVADAVNVTRDPGAELRPYRCDWSEEPPPNAWHTGVPHFHVGRRQTVRGTN